MPRCFFFFLRAREEGREKEREALIRCLSRCLWHWSVANWGPGPPPRRVPWLGIEPMTLQFAGRHSIHWTTPARATCLGFYPFCLYILLCISANASYCCYHCDTGSINILKPLDSSNHLMKVLEQVGAHAPLSKVESPDYWTFLGVAVSDTLKHNGF